MCQEKLVGPAGTRPGFLSIMSRLLIQRFKLRANYYGNSVMMKSSLNFNPSRTTVPFGRKLLCSATASTSSPVEKKSSIHSSKEQQPSPQQRESLIFAVELLRNLTFIDRIISENHRLSILFSFVSFDEGCHDIACDIQNREEEGTDSQGNVRFCFWY